MLRLSTFTIFLLLSLVSALGAEENPPFPLPLVIDFAADQFTEQEKQFLGQMLLSEVSGSDRRLAVWTLSSDDSAYVQQTGLPGKLEIFFDKEDDQYRYRAIFRRTADRHILMEISNSDGRQSVYRNPVRLFRPLGEGVRDLTSVLLTEDGFEDQAQHYRAILKIIAHEEAVISVSGVPVIDGNTEFLLPAPSIYEISISSPLHFPETFVVFLPLTGAEIVLKLQEAKAHFFDLYLADGNVPGFQWGYRLGKQRRWFLKAGGFTYLLTMIPMIQREKLGYSFFYSTPLSVLNLQAGIRFGEDNHQYRFYLSGGLFGRIVHSSNYFGLDPIGPGGLIGTTGLEILSGKRLSFFAEWTPHLFFTENIGTLQQFYTFAALKMAAPGSLDALLTIEHFRVGIRFQF